MNCLLCCARIISDKLIFKDNKQYYQCNNCELYFLDPKLRLNFEEERARYETHNNDITDSRYQKFVTPLLETIIQNVSQNSLGLDFGAGTGPVLSHMLLGLGYKTLLYDPYFHNDKLVLENKYDYIFACEVIEHLYNPRDEFLMLNKALNQGGKFFFMTEILTESIDFSTWYYRKDPTHVVFYSKKTFLWIKEFLNFNKLEFIENKIIVFQ